MQLGGKYVVLKNVVYKEYSTMTGFVDIWALVTSVKSEEDIILLNMLENQSIEIESFYKTA